MDCVLTVSQINTYMKAVVDGDHNLKNIYVSGEISNFTDHYRTGHFYFTLKDEKSAIKAVMFRNAAERVRFKVENGMKVLIRGNISVFERDGIYQLYCEDMQPDGEGALNLAFEQLKQKLFELGLFDEEKKKSLPKYPKRIGVITSPTGAAVHDILTVLERRYPLAQVVFEPAQVQGESAAPEIVKAIERFNLLKAADVIIVARGGGSIEDLWAFNEETVAYAIYNSDIPIISAVGHETDYTIADFVSDTRAPTPSAAAEIAVPDYREVLYALDGELDLLTDIMNGIISRRLTDLLNTQKRLELTSPKKNFEIYSNYLYLYSQRLKTSAVNLVNKYEGQLSAYCSTLEAASPLKAFSRGYALATDESGKTIKSVSSVSEGSRIKVTLNDGDILCTVDSVEIEGKE